VTSLNKEEQKAVEEQRNVNKFEKLPEASKELVEFTEGAPGSTIKIEERRKAIQKLLNEGCKIEKLAKFLDMSVPQLKEWLQK
jgi:hypothetical protein